MDRPKPNTKSLSEKDFHEFLLLCQERYLTMVAEGIWLWDGDTIDVEKA